MKTIVHDFFTYLTISVMKLSVIATKIPCLNLYVLNSFWGQTTYLGLKSKQLLIIAKIFFNLRRLPDRLKRWRHQIETSSALLALCAGNSAVSGEFPAQRPVTRSFDVFFDLCPNKRLSKQRWGWWFETSSCPLWRHCNEVYNGDSYPRKTASVE